MDLRVVGAGLGRTGTTSLKVALERLLGGPCYHMSETFSRPDHVARWQAAAGGEPTAWDAIFDGFVATVDWPSTSFWADLADANPGAVVLLSTRESAEAWWRSASSTIFPRIAGQPPDDPWRVAVERVLDLALPGGWDDAATAMAGYDAWNDRVRAECPPERLLEWRTDDGWGPLCERLGVDVPAEPFPHANTSAQFRARSGLE